MTTGGSTGKTGSSGRIVSFFSLSSICLRNHSATVTDSSRANSCNRILCHADIQKYIPTV